MKDYLLKLYSLLSTAETDYMVSKRDSEAGEALFSTVEDVLADMTNKLFPPED